MKALNKKLGKNGGFTLIEMLIVVAIIAILIAISIPLINSALERARDATDQANERSAKAEALIVYMGVAGTGTYAVSSTADGGAATYSAGQAFYAYYDAVDGKLVAPNTAATAINTYGQCSGCGSDYAKRAGINFGSTSGALQTDSTGATSHVGKVILVRVTAAGEVDCAWRKPA